VKVIWSREEDIQHDHYRPAFNARLSGGVDDSGKIVSWIGKNAGLPVFQMLNRDFAAITGFATIPYDIPNISVRSVSNTDIGIPVGAWRSPGSNQNIFFVESFMDELAHAAGIDPVQFRKTHLKSNSRSLAVLEKVSEMANWGSPGVLGAGQGIALNEAHGAFFGLIAEVSVKDGAVTVHKLYCAVDCGVAINPDIIKAQVEGGVIFGLTAALSGEITIKGGRVEQSNFHDCPLLGLKDAPVVETQIIESSANPGGVGEIAVPPIAPAVTNAIFSATGHRIRIMPISRYEFT